jgi:gliding motility-associated-like protein
VTSALGTDNQTACENTAITPITYTIGGSATGAIVSGLPSGINFSVSGGSLTISGSATLPGVYNFIATTTGGTCPSNITTGTLTIEAAPTLNLSSAVGTNNQTLCISSPLTTISYTFGGSATGTLLTGLPAGIISNTASSITSLSGSPSAIGTYAYSITTTGGTCPAATMNGTITVEQTPSIVLTSAIGTDNQTICENTSIIPIDLTVSGSATGVTFSGLPIGLNGNYSAGIATISGTASIAGTYAITVTTTGGTCTPTSYSINLTVETSPTLTLVSSVTTANQTNCINTAITTINYSYGGSATGVIFSGLPNGVSGTFSAGTASISGIPTQSGTYTYTLTTLGGTCTPITISGTISVQSSSISLSSASYTNDQLICLNSSIDTIIYAVGGPILCNDLPSGITGVYSPGTPNTFTISGTATSTGAYYYTLLASGTCGSLVVVGNITVAPTIPTNNAGVSLTVCEGSNFEFLGNDLNTNSTFNYEYQWLQSNSITGPWIPAYGLNNSFNYSGIAQMSSSFKFYRRIVTSGTCTDSSAVVQLTIDAVPSIIDMSSPVIICTNDTLIVSGLIASNGVFTNWFHNGNGTLINTASATPSYIPVAIDNGSDVTLSYVVSSSNTCAPTTISGTYTFSILSNPIAFAGGSATICASGAEMIVSGAQASNGTINWSHNGNGILTDTNTLAPHYVAVLADTNSTVDLLLTVTTTGCTNPIIDSAYYTVHVNPFGITPGINAFAGEDVTISLGQSIDLSAQGVAITNWSWSPAIGLNDSTMQAPVANPVVTTEYVLTVTDINGCIDQDTITVTVLIDYNVFIPNLFTPNGDHSNDVFEIVGLENYPNATLSIINREGQMVYSNASYDNTWDGTYDGKALPEATYYYHLQLENTDKIYKGAVTILRSKK